MAGSEKPEEGVNGVTGNREGGEDEFMEEGMAVLDFDVLCSTVAMQTQGKWRKLEGDGGVDEFGGVLRMWEGEILDCFEDRRIALESVCCPCYRFGKNMKRAGFGSCCIQGAAYFILTLMAIFNWIAYGVTLRHYFLYLAVAFTISIAVYMGFFRTQMKKKFNIRGSDSSLDDCAYHIICPCCTLCQESRTLEMNNVLDGMWQGRGDTICIGSSSEGSKAFIGLNPSSSISIGFPCQSGMHRDTDGRDCTATSDAGQLEPLVVCDSLRTSDSVESVPLIL